MSNNFPPPVRSKRRKLSVEVYFVLYLTAIILLLGTAPLSKERYDAELEEAIAKLINTDFGVEVEDIALIVPFVPAGMENDSGFINLQQDTVNVIRAHGSFSRVEFRIVAIQDTGTGQRLPIEKATLMRNGDSSALFLWNQGEARQTAIYRISVEAEAKPIIPSSVSSPELRRRIEEIIAKRNEMWDTATFNVSVLPINSPELMIAARRAPTLGGSAGDTGMSAFALLSAQMEQMMRGFGRSISVAARNPNLTVPPGRPWEQRLIVAGINPHHLRLKLSPGVQTAGVGNDYIDLTGTAPSGGTQEIKVLATPVEGGQPIEAYFTVSATSLSDPKGLPRTLYEGGSYSVDFTTVGVDEGRISVDIVENGKTVARNKGAYFTYIPSSNGRVEFFRFVDGKPYGEYGFPVEQYPKASIVRMNYDKNTRSVVVTTTVLSTYNGAPNATQFRIEKGNAKDPVRESSETDPATGRTETTWRIYPKNPSERFEFTVRAWDMRGRDYSTIQPFSE